MKCQNCGAINTNGSIYCNQCGEKLFHEITPNQEEPKRKRGLQYIILIIAVIVLSLIIFFGVTYLKQYQRNKTFNLELQEILREGLSTNSIAINVSGKYGSLITHTENDDDISEILSTADTEEEEILIKQLMSQIYKYYCMDYFTKRLELFITYSEKEEYATDKIFQVFSYEHPVCIINTPLYVYEYYENNNGELIFTINGEIEEIKSAEMLFPYGNPSPSLTEMMDEYETELNAKDVQYDMPNHVGENFGLEGTGNLCDYYNWGYDESIESQYFCMEVKPNGGEYGDYWYIYGNRNSFSKLYEPVARTLIKRVFFMFSMG